MTAADPAVLFNDLLRHHRGRIAAVARAYAILDEEDLYQEILMQIWRSLPKFRGDANLGTWAYRVAINTSLAWRRSAARRKNNLPTTAATPTPADDSRPAAATDHLPARPDAGDPAAVLQSFLPTLGDTDRAVLLMYLNDQPRADIAAVIGVSEPTLRVRLHRIEQKFRGFMETQS